MVSEHALCRQQHFVTGSKGCSCLWSVDFSSTEGIQFYSSPCVHDLNHQGLDLKKNDSGQMGVEECVN